MKSLLDMLYDGELYPLERARRDAAYWALSRTIAEKQQAFADGLDEEQFRAWQELDNLETDLRSMELQSMFRCGFRLGCGLMEEVHTGWPLEKT